MNMESRSVAPGFRPVRNALCSSQALVEDEHGIDGREGVEHGAGTGPFRTGRKPGATSW
jgi:hypothetical protein